MNFVEVVDTNVVLVANGQHSDVSPDCVAACAARLEKIMRSGRLALDDEWLILMEYQNKCDARRGRGPGDAFVKWALQNNANVSRVDRVKIESHADRGYQSFPDHGGLHNFDNSDRKFVAVACEHNESPPILQATDSKWLQWSDALAECGIAVEFLCKADIEKFHKNKLKG